MIIATVHDLVADFLYYDRKECEDLPRGEIEAAIKNLEVSTTSLAFEFEAALDRALLEAEDGTT